nr:hypothetical protein [Tanacetum cinerariifolium]
MELGFLSQLGSRGGRGVKEKQHGLSNDSVKMHDNGIHDGLKEGAVGNASLTQGDAPTSSSSTVGRTKELKSPNKNGGEYDDNELILNKFPSSYITKLSPTSLTKANLQNLKVNVPNDTDYEVWLPLASVLMVNDRMNNSPYGYFIGKRLAFHAVEWFMRNNWEKYGFKKTSGADEEGFIEVTRKKSGGNNGGNKNFKPVFFKPKTLYRPKAKQLAKGTSNSPKTTSFIGTNKASTSVMGNMATTSGTQKERQSTTPRAKRINVFEKQMLEGKLVLVDDNWKQLEKVDYSDNTGSEDEIKPGIMKLQVFMHPN